MNRREFLRGALIAGSACLLPRELLALGMQGGAAKRPNIVFFYIDDMGWQDTSEPFYTSVTDLNRRYITPCIEKLADDGVKFTQAYSCAVCSPSRVSLMTGMNAARHRVTSWLKEKNKFPVPNTHPVVQMPLWNLNGLCPFDGLENTVYARTFPMYLQDAGYRTIHVGKAHWGARGTPGDDPLKLGFDVNIGGSAAGNPSSYYGLDNFSRTGTNGESPNDIIGLESYHGRDIFLTEALTIEANREIDEAVKAGRPFFLNLAHYAVHSPLQKDERFYQKYSDRGLDAGDAAYASMLEGMDKSLGDIRANLKRNGIEDNTIIVFMSDNGAAEDVPLNLPLRDQKRSPYEGGIRVPMIVSWPGVTAPGRVCDDYVISEDIFPSFLEMAGVHDYSQIGGVMDGESFVPLLRNESPRADRPLFWHFPHVNIFIMPYSIIHKGEWKLIYFYKNRKYELYNLAEDISEKKNLFKNNKSLARPLAEELRAHLTEANAQVPIYRNSGKPMRLPG
ncbi:MAG TPA: sulfatase [bacterium]|nr:sulfatase [bacterium]